MESGDYGDNAFVYPGLEDELKRNLYLQQQKHFVCTDVLWEGIEGMSFQFVPSNTYDNDGRAGIRAEIRIKKGSIQERYFKDLDIFPLFTLMGRNEYSFDGQDVYFIDYGEDYKSAARFFTIIADKVFGYGKSTIIQFNTWSDAKSESKNNSENTAWKIILAIVAGGIALIIALSSI